MDNTRAPKENIPGEPVDEANICKSMIALDPLVHPEVNRQQGC